MRQRFRSGLVAAMEEETIVENAIIEATEPPVIPDAAESAETQLLDVNEQIHEGDAQAVEVGEAIEVSDALDEYAEAIKISEEQGGLSAESLQILNIGLKHCYARVGLPTKNVALESLENRKVTAKVAMESIADKAKEVFKAIVEAIKRGIQWIADFFKSAFSAIGALQVRARKIKEAARASKFEITGNIEDKPELFYKLSVNGRVKVEKSADELLRFADGTLLESFKEVSKMSNALAKSIADANYGGSEEAFADIVRSIYYFANLHTTVILPGENKLMLDTKEVKKFFDEYKHQMSLAVNNPNDVSIVATAYRKGLIPAFSYIKENYKFESNVEISSGKNTVLPALKATEIETTMERVEKILEAVKSFEKESKHLENECNITLQKAEKIVSIANKIADDRDSVDVIQSMFKLASLNLSVGMVISSQSVRIVTNFSKAAMDYSELSLKKAA